MPLIGVMKRSAIEKEESGFEDDPTWNPKDMCLDPSHNPPTHISIPFGKQYRHVCPTCGFVAILRNNIVFMQY